MGVFTLFRHFFFCLYIGTIITPFRLRLVDFNLMPPFCGNPGSGSSVFTMNGYIHIPHNNGKHRYHKCFNDYKQY